MDNDIYVKNKSWWARNWKWFVPTGCLSIIVVMVLFGLAIFTGVSSMMKNSDVYIHTMDVTQKSTLVIAQLGKHIETDGMTSGNISTTNYSGNADLTIPLKG